MDKTPPAPAVRYWVHRVHCVAETEECNTWPNGVPNNYINVVLASDYDRDLAAVREQLKAYEGGALHDELVAQAQLITQLQEAIRVAKDRLIGAGGVIDALTPTEDGHE